MSNNHEQDDPQIRNSQSAIRNRANPQSAIRNSSESAIRNSSMSAIGTLRRFMRPRAVVERCEMCSTELPPEHQHLVEPTSRQIICACQPCAILFSDRAGTKYRRVPRRIRALTDFRLTDAQWESLALPIHLAFFFHSSPADRVVALYPSPAGPTESLLDLEAWKEIVQDNPLLQEIEPDVEALLVNRVGERRDYYLVPIDECYKLVGLIRAHWRGLSGGAEVWTEIEKFFAGLKEASSPTAVSSEAATNCA